MCVRARVPQCVRACLSVCMCVRVYTHTSVACNAACQGALAPLIRLLRTGDAQAQSDAADALASLSFFDEIAEVRACVRACSRV